jgi:hypothetical protein
MVQVSGLRLLNSSTPRILFTASRFRKQFPRPPERVGARVNDAGMNQPAVLKHGDLCRARADVDAGGSDSQLLAQLLQERLNPRPKLA